MSKNISSYKEYLIHKKAFDDELKMMCKKNRPHNVFVCSGQAGIGKTHTAEAIFNKYAEVPFLAVKGSISAVKLYAKMWQHPDAVIILDDINEILKDPKNGAALLKVATDSYPSRVISWEKRNPDCIPVSDMGGKYENNDDIKRAMDNYVKDNGTDKLAKRHAANETFPSMFFFSGALVILTNKSLRTIDTVTEGAVTNRGAHMEISFTLEGMMNFLTEFSKTFKSYLSTTFKKDTLSVVLKFLKSEPSMNFLRKFDRMISIRNLGSIASQYQDHGKKLDLTLLETNTEPRYYG